MKIPPRWKVARELRRLGRRARKAPAHLTTYLFSALYYDQVLAKRKSEISGKLSERSKIAVFLIFPQYGVKPSHLRALDHFERKGYATLVVSNVELSEKDGAEILKRCWRLILRPNFGYDFGGYRDGILALRSRLKKLDRLVLMNDSCWFPLSDRDNWLEKAETLGPDFVGATSHYGAPRPDVDNLRTIQWSYRKTHPNFHYTSFALSISSKILKDVRFLKYWKRLPVTNDKARTVRRGEIGLTHWISRRGYTHGSTLNIENLDGKLSQLDTKRLQEVARNTILLEDVRLQASKSQYLQEGRGTDRDTLIVLILAGVARQGASYALADYAIYEENHSFLKKSPLWLNKESSDITLELVQKLSDPFSTNLLEEAHELRAKKAQF